MGTPNTAAPNAAVQIGPSGDYVYLLNADGTSYISIANQYWRGNWGQAVNGFWGPLLSWLLIPFLAGVAVGLRRCLNVLVHCLV